MILEYGIVFVVVGLAFSYIADADFNRVQRRVKEIHEANKRQRKTT